MTKCPKCGCDWEKWHYRVIAEWEGMEYYCLNCGNHLCYIPQIFDNSGIDGLQSDKPLCFGTIGTCPLWHEGKDANYRNCPFWIECRDYPTNRTKKPNPSRRDSLNHDI